MLSKYYTNDVMSPYFNLFDVDPFKLADEIYGTRYGESSYRVEKTDSGIALSIDLPGVKSDSLTVKTAGKEIRVEGRVRGKDFKHAYVLSKDYDPDTVEATLEAGVLEMNFKRKATIEPKIIDVVVK